MLLESGLLTTHAVIVPRVRVIETSGISRNPRHGRAVSGPVTPVHRGTPLQH
jgi:hypothetical protein